MNKKILLIGNNDGLPGVKVDLENYKKYFKSSIGGQWNDNEIIEKLNPKKDNLISYLNTLKNENLDYLIIIFSGHGGMKRETILELNSEGENFSESRFNSIAIRQVTILDCCRVSLQSINENISNLRLTKAFTDINTRARFEKRILQSPPQQIKLYSCAEGEYSHDTPKGGAYSKNLLETAYADESEFIYFGRTHVTAATKTTREFSDQNPEIIQPRLTTTQQLILGIN